ncbi:hypothetical protein OY671_010046, partial [Metschnikowia pulcherrima]
AERAHVRACEDHPARRFRARSGAGHPPGGHRRRDRAGAGQGGPRRARRWRAARHHAPARSRRAARARYREGRGGRARTRPARLRAPAGGSGSGAVSGHADHVRPGDRRRVLLRLRAKRPPLHRRRPARDRGEDARADRRRQAAAPRGSEPRAA